MIPIALLAMWLAAPPAAIRTVRLEHRVFPGLHEMDGNWAALFAASDGKVYAGLAYHGGDGHLAYYDSKTDRMYDAGNLTELCGESHLKRGPQSKIHAKFGEGKDGRIYFGTHAGYWWDYARFATKEGYPGAHWMAFDPKTGRVEDFGLGVPNEGVNTGAYDPLFNRIYGLTHPRGHFVYYDVATRRAVDKGRVNNFESICRTLGIDDEGKVYGSFGQGQIFRYDPRTDEIIELSARIPIREKGVSLGRDYFKSETAWRTVVWDSQTRQFYGVDESATILFSFNPRASDGGEVRRLGQLSIPAYDDSREVPYATLSLTLGHDRKLYYGAAGREFDYGGSAWSSRGAPDHLRPEDGEARRSGRNAAGRWQPRIRNQCGRYRPRRNNLHGGRHRGAAAGGKTGRGRGQDRRHLLPPCVADLSSAVKPC